MIIKIKKANQTEIFDVSKKLLIGDLKTMIEEKLSVKRHHQRLIFRGKQLSEDNTLFEADVDLNSVIQLWEVKAPLPPPSASKDCPCPDNDDDDKENKENSSAAANKVKVVDEKEESKEEKAAIVEEKTETEFFKVNDILDIKDVEESESAGAYFEGEVVKIQVVDGELVYLCKYDAYDGDDYKVKESQLRPRARRLVKSRGLEAGMEVLVNYNLQEPKKRGFWFRAKVEKVRPNLVCTIYIGVDDTPVEGCKVIFPDEVFRLEQPVKVKERDEKLEHEMNTPVPRKHPPKCESCMDNEKKKCKDCGCHICGGKNDPDSILICDECQMGFHLKCLKMDVIPEDDEWFCPDCKNVDDIVKAGQKQEDGKKKKNMASKKNPECTRDWGKGFATVGRTKECKIVDKDHSGAIPGVEVGESWLLRLQVSEAGVHRPHVAGICGTGDKGCVSLVLSGGYEDDVDDGDEFTYTGSGGRDLSGNKRTAPQSFDQELTSKNKALAINCKTKFDDKKGGDAGDDWKKGRPIRVVRGWKGQKHSKYAPQDGCRYDGLYKVVKYWPQKGKAGFIVWRYLLRRDDPAPAPWTKEGKKRMEEGGWADMQYPENYLENQAKKLAEKAAKLDEEVDKPKGKGKKRKNSGELDPRDNSKQKKVPVAKYKVSAEHKEAMKKDKLNEKLWKELQVQELKTRKDLVEAVEEMFSCVVCMGVVTIPVTLECLHNFCQTCIKRGVKAEGAVCPCCRAEINSDKMAVNQPLRDALNLILPGYEGSA